MIACRAVDQVENAGHGEATLFALGDAFAGHDLGIDESQRLVSLLAHVEHQHALVDVDLGRSQPDAGGGVHRLEHVFDQAADPRIHGHDRLRLGAKPRIRVLQYGEDCHVLIEPANTVKLRQPGGPGTRPLSAEMLLKLSRA